MQTKECLAEKMFKKDCVEVLNFLNEVAPEKGTFRTEKSFLNFVARHLKPMLRKKGRQWEKKSLELEKQFWEMDEKDDEARFELLDIATRYVQNEKFWYARAMSIDCDVNKKHNILWCIRLLKGGYGAPEEL